MIRTYTCILALEMSKIRRFKSTLRTSLVLLGIWIRSRTLLLLHIASVSIKTYSTLRHAPRTKTSVFGRSSPSKTFSEKYRAATRLWLRTQISSSTRARLAMCLIWRGSWCSTLLWSQCSSSITTLSAVCNGHTNLTRSKPFQTYTC